MAKKVARILSIDGGGIRGLIPATILAPWETQLGPIAKLFHMVAGTSTGGIIGAGLCQPKGMKSQALADFYREKGKDIFSSSFSSLGGLTGELYPAEPLEAAIKSVISGNLSDVIPVDLMLTSYNLESRAPHMFKSWEARGIDTKDLPTKSDFALCDVCRSTSAAPTYFQPAQVKNAASESFNLIDGGVYANNPAMAAYVAARRLYPLADEYFIVSIGTGALTRPIPYDEASSWGLAGWLRPLLDIMFDGVSTTTDYELAQLSPGVTYTRFQTSLANASQEMDNVTPENLAALVSAAEETSKTQAAAMASVLARLSEPKTDRASMGYPKALTGPAKTTPKVPSSALTPSNVPAVSGAALGAVAGTAIFPGVGTIIGAVAGWFGGTKVAEKRMG